MLLSSTPRRTGGSSRVNAALAIAALAAILPALGACQGAGTAVDATSSVYPSDFRERHPIVLADGPRVLDVFVGGPGGLVLRERQDVAAFLAEYRRTGTGPLIAQVPSGHGANPATGRALSAIREATGGRLSVSSYRPADPTVASPIRLSFKQLQAKVGSTCGLWPQDLGVSDAEFSFRNQPYWNFGCASQANFAAQIADPADLVRGRPETAPDTVKRMNAIGKIRQGQDPSTQYNQQAVTVSSAVSQ